MSEKELCTRVPEALRNPKYAEPISDRTAGSGKGISIVWQLDPTLVLETHQQDKLSTTSLCSLYTDPKTEGISSYVLSVEWLARDLVNPT